MSGLYLMSKNYGRCVGIAFLGLCTGLPASYAEQAVPVIDAVAAVEEERGLEHGKINTPDASPVDPGHFEIESSYTYVHAKRFWDNDGNSHARGLAREQAIGLSVTAGVVENFDVAVGGSYVWLKDEDNDFDENDAEIGPVIGHNFGDLELSGRYRFFESKERSLELAYLAGFTIPVGNDASREEIGTSQEYWSFSQALVATKDWGQWTANTDIGYALPLGDKRENARGTFNADVAVGYQVLPWLQPEIELNYAHDFLTTEDDQEVLATTVGLVMPLDDRLRVNVGVQQGLWGRNANKDTTLCAAVKLAF
jgi:hypothetical protein